MSFDWGTAQSASGEFDWSSSEPVGKKSRSSFQNREKGRQGGIPQAAADYPHQAEATIFADLINGLEELGHWGSLKGNSNNFSLSNYIKEKGGVNELPEDVKKELDILSGVANTLLMLPRGGLKGGSKQPLLPGGPRPPTNKPPSGKRTLTDVYEERAALPPKEGLFGRGITEASLEKRALPEELPVSRFETAEKAREELQPLSHTQPLAIKVPVTPREGGKPLHGLVKEKSSPESSISPEEFRSEAEGGQALSKSIGEQASLERKEVGQAYKAAEDEYGSIEDFYPELSKQLHKMREDLGTSLRPNTAESTVLKTIDGLLSDLGDANMGYKSLPVKRIIKASDSISGMANYELPFTGPKEILKKMASLLDQAALKAIEAKGGNPELMKVANKKYSQWADKFANDEIEPFLRKKNLDPRGLFKSASEKEGVFRAVEGALQNSPKGSEYSNAIARKFAESSMGQYGRKELQEVGSKQYEKDLRELKALIGEQRATAYDKALKEKQKTSFKRFNKDDDLARLPKAREPERPQKLEALAKKAALYSKMTPETIISKTNSRSGIKQLRQELGSNISDKLVNQKIRSILRDGGVERTGNDLYNILNKESNAEIFIEAFGEDQYKAFLQVAKALSKEKVTINAINILIRKGLLPTAVGVRAISMLKALGSLI